MINKETLLLAAVTMATSNFPRCTEGNVHAAKNYDEAFRKKILENYEWLSEQLNKGGTISVGKVTGL